MRLTQNRIVLNMENSCFRLPSVTFFGYHVSSEGVRAAQKLIAALREFPRLDDVRDFRASDLLAFLSQVVLLDALPGLSGVQRVP